MGRGEWEPGVQRCNDRRGGAVFGGPVGNVRKEFNTVFTEKRTRRTRRRMSRSAQDVLEFDKLRELLRLRTTCAPGRRVIDALEVNTNRGALESVFALIREAREWLRLGRELGFGALADPETWMARLEAPGVGLEAKEFLEAGPLLETASCLKQQFREAADKYTLRASR